MSSYLPHSTTRPAQFGRGAALGCCRHTQRKASLAVCGIPATQAWRGAVFCLLALPYLIYSSPRLYTNLNMISSITSSSGSIVAEELCCYETTWVLNLAAA